MSTRSLTMMRSSMTPWRRRSRCCRTRSVEIAGRLRRRGRRAVRCDSCCMVAEMVTVRSWRSLMARPPALAGRAWTRRTDTAGTRARSLRTADPAASAKSFSRSRLPRTPPSAMVNICSTMTVWAWLNSSTMRSPSGRSSAALAAMRPPPARIRARARRFIGGHRAWRRRGYGFELEADPRPLPPVPGWWLVPSNHHRYRGCGWMEHVVGT